jgi:hypothetical protein
VFSCLLPVQIATGHYHVLKAVPSSYPNLPESRILSYSGSSRIYPHILLIRQVTRNKVAQPRCDAVMSKRRSAQFLTSLVLYQEA